MAIDKVAVFFSIKFSAVVCWYAGCIESFSVNIHVDVEKTWPETFSHGIWWVHPRVERTHFYCAWPSCHLLWSFRFLEHSCICRWSCPRRPWTQLGGSWRCEWIPWKTCIAACSLHFPNPSKTGDLFLLKFAPSGPTPLLGGRRAILDLYFFASNVRRAGPASVRSQTWLWHTSAADSRPLQWLQASKRASKRASKQAKAGCIESFRVNVHVDVEKTWPIDGWIDVSKTMS